MSWQLLGWLSLLWLCAVLLLGRWIVRRVLRDVERLLRGWD